MTIEEFADVIGQELVVRYYPNQNTRWSCSFALGYIYDGCGYLGAFENGKTPEEAIEKYARRIAGTTIVFHAGIEDRAEFGVPEGLTQ